MRSTAAVSLLGLVLALPAWAWAQVQGSCVNRRCNDGSLVACNGSCPEDGAARGAPSGPGGLRGAILQGVQQATQNLAKSFVDWLLGGDKAAEQRRLEEERQRQERARLQAEAEARRQQQEEEERRRRRAAFKREKKDLLKKLRERGKLWGLRTALGGMRGVGHGDHHVLGALRGLGTEPLVAKDLSTGARPQQTLTAVQNHARTIDCAMAEIYRAADGLGPGGRRFAASLELQVKEAQRALPKETAGAGSSGDQIIALSRDSASEGVAGSSQLIAKLLVSRALETGRTTVDIQFSLLKNGQSEHAGQSIAIFNSAGIVECQQVTPATARCMAGFSPGSATPDYCPKPPPTDGAPDASTAPMEQPKLR